MHSMVTASLRTRFDWPRRHDLLIEGGHPRRDRFPAIAEYRRAGVGRERGAQRRVVEKARDLLGKGLRSPPGNEQTILAIVNHGWQPSHHRPDHRRATGQRLHCDEPKALVVRRHNQNVGGVVVRRKLLLRNCPSKQHVEVEAVRERPTATELLLLARSADDDELQGWAMSEQRDRAQQDIEPLHPIHPSDEENDLSIEAQSCTGNGPVERTEEAQVHSTIDHGDAFSASSIELYQRLTLVLARGNHPIGRGDDVLLDLDAGFALLLGRQRVVLEPAERVEHGHVWNTPARRHEASHPAAEPVVAVDHVVLDTFYPTEALEIADEFGQDVSD